MSLAFEKEYEQTEMSPLILACQQADDELVATLLMDAMTEITATDNYGNSALWAACYSECSGCIDMLLNHHIDINYQNPTGNTALMFASSSGRDNIVKLLLERGADASLENQDGMTALDLATSLGSFKMLRALSK